jgi:hypothetical protein
MLDLRRQELAKHQNLSFDEFHSIVCKSMPSVNDNPQMYNLCYDLMKLSWETAQRQPK